MILHRVQDWLRNHISRRDASDTRLPQEEASRPLFSLRADDDGRGAVQIPSVGLMSLQPIWDRVQRIIGYQIHLNEPKNVTEKPETDLALRRDADRALLAKLKRDDGLSDLIPYRKSFIQIGFSSLFDPNIRHPSTLQIVYILEQNKGQVVGQQHIAQVDVLIEHGMRFAVEPASLCLDDQDTLHDLLLRTDYFILDFSKPIPSERQWVFDWIQKKMPYVNWYGRNIRDDDDFQSALSGFCNRRFVLFHGDFISSEQHEEQYMYVATPKAHPQQSKILLLLRALRRENNHTQLANLFRSDPILSFRLLRFVNSPVTGLARQIHSIEECLILLGRNVVFRWLSLMLFSHQKKSQRSFALLERSLIRARFLENLGRAKNCRADEAEHLFLTGLFSLLDLVLGQPLREIIHQNDLPLSTRDVLIFSRGPFMPAFELLLAYEQGQAQEVRILSQNVQVSTDRISELYLESVIWVQSVLTINQAGLDEM